MFAFSLYVFVDNVIIDLRVLRQNTLQILYPSPTHEKLEVSFLVDISSLLTPAMD